MSTPTPTTSTERRRSARNMKAVPVNMPESNSDNSNDNDDNQNTRSSDARRGESNACSKKKNKDVLIESNDNNETHDDGDNKNGMDNNGKLLLSRIMNIEETSVRSRSKKPLTNSYGDDHDDMDEFKLVDENLNHDKDPPAHVFLKGKPSWNKGKTTNKETIAKVRDTCRKRRLAKLEQQGITEEEHLEQKRKQRRQYEKEYRKRVKERDMKKSNAGFNITSTPTTSTDRRSLRKRKASPVNMQESDSDDCGIGDDGEFKVHASTKLDDDDIENLSDDAATKKEKSSSNQDNKEQKQEGSATGSNDAETDDDDDDEADRPMLTQNWGYSHTQKAKIKISIANKGNTPWNKGRIRSEEDKAKISAGVLARNRIVLLAKLEKLGMTEDEWHAQKKKLKYARENDRRKCVKERKREAALNAHTPEEIEAVEKEEECHEQKRKQKAKYKRERLKRKESEKLKKEASLQAHSAPEEIEAELSIARANQNKIVSTPSMSTGRRSLRKRKAAPANMQESDSDNNNDDDDYKYEALVSDFMRRR